MLGQEVAHTITAVGSTPTNCSVFPLTMRPEADSRSFGDQLTVDDCPPRNNIQ